MSNKCRGSYTIKGQGTDALVREMNKFVQLHEEPLQVGGGMVTCSFVDITPILGAKWTAAGHLGPNGVPETVYFAGIGDDWPLIVKDGQATFWAETRWAPPVDALTILSELYPVEITLSYSLQSYNWMNGRTLRFHQGKVTLLQYGDFVLADQGQPIHHWLVKCLGSAVKLIEEAGITLVEVLGDDVGDEPAPEQEVVVAVRDADIPRVRGIAGVGECLAYTLDEASFIESVQTDIEWGAYPLYHPYGEDLAPVERPISLTPEEVEVLRNRMWEDALKWAKWHKSEPPRTEERPPCVTEVELARYARYYGHICTLNPCFRPTAKEIKMLLDHVSPERRQELLEALGKPEWVKTRRPLNWRDEQLREAIGEWRQRQMRGVREGLAHDIDRDLEA